MPSFFLRAILQTAEVKRSKEKMVETGADKNAILLTLDIHSGVAGIVSGKLKEDFGKVAIVMVDTGDGYLKASGRSPDAIDLYQLLLKFQDLYVNFGGHSAACGFTIKKSDENVFRERFYRAVDDMMKTDPGILESGAEIYRVEDTAARICGSYENVQSIDVFSTYTVRRQIGRASCRERV